VNRDRVNPARCYRRHNAGVPGGCSDTGSSGSAAAAPLRLSAARRRAEESTRLGAAMIGRSSGCRRSVRVMMRNDYRRYEDRATADRGQDDPLPKFPGVAQHGVDAPGGLRRGLSDGWRGLSSFWRGLSSEAARHRPPRRHGNRSTFHETLRHPCRSEERNQRAERPVAAPHARLLDARPRRGRRLHRAVGGTPQAPPPGLTGTTVATTGGAGPLAARSRPVEPPPRSRRSYGAPHRRPQR